MVNFLHVSSMHRPLPERAVRTGWHGWGQGLPYGCGTVIASEFPSYQCSYGSGAALLHCLWNLSLSLGLHPAALKMARPLADCHSPACMSSVALPATLLEVTQSFSSSQLAMHNNTQIAADLTF